MKHHPFSVALLVCCLVTSSLPAQEKRAPEQLNALSTQAMDAARGGKMADAIAIWMDILDEVPAETQLAIHFNLSLAYRKLGRLPEAWHHVTLYVHRTGRKDEKAAALLLRIEEGLTAGGFVKSAIVCIPEGAQVLLGAKADRSRVYPCPLTWWFKPGRHPVGARMKGYELKAEQLEILAHGSAGAHTLKLQKKKEPVVAEVVKPEPRPEPPPATAPTTITAAPEEHKRFKWEPWSLVAAGGALIIGGTVMQLVAYSRNEDLLSSYPQAPDSYDEFQSNKAAYAGAFESDVKPLRTTSFVFYGVGSAAALAGAVWLLADRPRSSPGLTLAPMLAPEGTGAYMTIGF